MPTASLARTTLAAATSTAVLSASPNRMGLIISSDDTSRYTLGFDSPVVQDSGIQIPAKSAPMRLQYDCDGEVVRKALYAISPGTPVVAIVEIFE